MRRYGFLAAAILFAGAAPVSANQPPRQAPPMPPPPMVSPMFVADTQKSLDLAEELYGILSRTDGAGVMRYPQKKAIDDCQAEPERFEACVRPALVAIAADPERGFRGAPVVVKVVALDGYRVRWTCFGATATASVEIDMARAITVDRAVRTPERNGALRCLQTAIGESYVDRPEL